MSKEERRAAWERMLAEQGYDEQFRVLEDCRAKEVLWFYTGQGPFESYLAAMKKSPTALCRFCEAELESPAHLMYECSGFSHIPDSCLETLTSKIRHIVVSIYKLQSGQPFRKSRARSNVI